jgi:tetratricopeptide (TPR) repeat protein
MAARWSRLALPPALCLPFALAAPRLARAEGEEEAPKPKKQETDDTSIFKDWKLCKARGAAHCKTRAGLWAEKGIAGKDLFWLGLMWNRGEAYDKATSTLEQFCEWTPAPGDEKAAKDNAINRETARKELVTAYTKLKQYDKAIAAAEKYREDFPEGKATSESWDDQGRAHRLAGDEAKAIDAFTKAAEGEFNKGLIDLVDVHLAAGRIDDARAVFAKFAAGAKADGGDGEGPAPAPKVNPTVEQLRLFLDVVGTAAPSLEGAVSVGTARPQGLVEAHGAPLLGQTTGNADRRLVARSPCVGATATRSGCRHLDYNKYNPQTLKVESTSPGTTGTRRRSRTRRRSTCCRR